MKREVQQVVEGSRPARLRDAVLDALNEDDAREIVRVVVARAKDGDLAACRIALSYMVPPEIVRADPGFSQSQTQTIVYTWAGEK